MYDYRIVLWLLERKVTNLAVSKAAQGWTTGGPLCGRLWPFSVDIKPDLELNGGSDAYGWAWCAGWSCIDRGVVVLYDVVLSWS